MQQLDDETARSFMRIAAEFLDGLVSHYVLDDGKLVVAHAGMKEEMQGRGSGSVREFALYGETTGETDEFGLPVRYNWAAEYRGKATVVYGHTPVPEPEWLNHTINIDTGCVFGGKLTALRYPEREFVSVPALQSTTSRRGRFLPAEDMAPHLLRNKQLDDLLDIEDVIGKRIIETRLHRTRHDSRGKCHRGAGSDEPVCGESEMADLSAADDVAHARRAKPTVCSSIRRRRSLIILQRRRPQVVCEEKHMGSRAVVVICRDEDAARERFGVTEGEGRDLSTRAPDGDSSTMPRWSAQFLERLRNAADECRALG